MNGGAFSTPSDYIRSLIRDDQRRHAHDQHETALLAGLGSGPPIDHDAMEWEGIEADAIVRVETPRRKAPR